MRLKVFQTGVGLGTAFKLQGENKSVTKIRVKYLLFAEKTWHKLILTVHLWGFSPVCLRMWTTSMYWALKGFCSREQSSHRHTNSFFSPWMWSLLMCYKMTTEKKQSLHSSCSWSKNLFWLTDFQFKKALAQIFSISSSALFSITFVPAQLS